MEDLDEKAKQFLTELGTQLGLPELAFSEQNAVSLEAGGKVEIQIEWEAESRNLVFLAQVGHPPEDRREAVFRALLEENFLFSGTYGETLCVDPDRGRIMICLLLPLELWPVDQIQGRFVRFLEVALHWIDRLNERFPDDDDDGGGEGGDETVRFTPLGSLA